MLGESKLHNSTRHLNKFTKVAIGICCLALIYTWFFQIPRTDAATNHHANHSPIVIQHTETVHDLFVISRTVDVAGDVSDNLVAIDATVRLEPGAHVDTLLAIGGHVERAPGSTIRNGLLFTPQEGIRSHIGLGISFVFFAIILKFMASLAFILLSVVLGLTSRRWLYRPLQHLEKSLRRSFAMGALINIGVGAAAIGFAMTGTGTPVSMILMLCDVLLGLIGLTHTSVYAGRMILRRYQAEPAIWRCALIGSLVIVAAINFPLAGILVFFVLWCISTSSAVAMLNLTRRKR